MDARQFEMRPPLDKNEPELVQHVVVPIDEKRDVDIRQDVLHQQELDCKGNRPVIATPMFERP